MVLGKLSKVGHERIDRILHMQMSDRYPNRIFVVQFGDFLLFPSDSVFIFVPDCISPGAK